MKEGKTTALQALRWLMDDLRDSGEDRNEEGVIFDSCKGAYDVLERLEKKSGVQQMPPVKGTVGRPRPAFKALPMDLMPGIEKLLDTGPEPTKTESAPFDSVECEVKTGKDWLLTYWWWKDKSWWVAEKLWKAIVEPVVIEYLHNNDPEKHDDPHYLEGLMSEFDFKALDTKLIELLQFADEEQERNAGFTKVEGE